MLRPVQELEEVALGEVCCTASASSALVFALDDTLFAIAILPCHAVCLLFDNHDSCFPLERVRRVARPAVSLLAWGHQIGLDKTNALFQKAKCMGTGQRRGKEPGERSDGRTPPTTKRWSARMHVS